MRSKPRPPNSSATQDLRAVRTREALRVAMLKLLRAKPFDEITIRDISASANIGYATFFRHHATKADLLDSVAAAEIQRLIDLVLPVLDAGRSREISMTLFTYVHKHRSLWSTLLTGGAAGNLRQEFLRLARQVAVTRAKPNQWLPPEVAVLLMIGGTLDLLGWWLRQKNPESIEKIAEIHERIVVSPAFENAGRTGRQESGAAHERRSGGAARR